MGRLSDTARIIAGWSLLACGGGRTLDATPDGGVGADAAAFDKCPSIDGSGPWRDFTSPDCWSSFDITALNPKAGGYEGGTFDGRYIYFAPSGGSNPHGLALRYDTQGQFADPSAWSVFDLTALDTDAKGFAGAVFDGRYVYLVPYNGSHVARFDSQRPFGDAASWSLFDLSTLGAGSPASLVGGTFDGRYVYMTPFSDTPTAFAFDTHASFADPSSWATFTIGMFHVGQGAVFDGTYVYMMGLAQVARFDSRSTFAATSSWSVYSGNPLGTAFLGGAFDGRYVYLVPDPSPAGGSIVRLDTQQTFSTPSAWSTFDVSNLGPGGLAIGAGAAFDGRFVYFLPEWDPSIGPSEVLARYDTQSTFEDHASWSAVTPGDVGQPPGGWGGAVFDGRYLYLAPDAHVLRFEARSGSQMPALPAFHGSFF